MVTIPSNDSILGRGPGLQEKLQVHAYTANGTHERGKGRPMKRCLNRRGFLNAVGVAGLEIGLAGAPRLWAAEPVHGAPHAEKIGWRLGCHAYSFNRFTLFDAIEKTACLGLRSIEAYEGQKLSNYWPNVFVTEALPGDLRKSLKQKLADSGVCDNFHWRDLRGLGKLLAYALSVTFTHAGSTRWKRRREFRRSSSPIR